MVTPETSMATEMSLAEAIFDQNNRGDTNKDLEVLVVEETRTKSPISPIQTKKKEIVYQTTANNSNANTPRDGL